MLMTIAWTWGVMGAGLGNSAPRRDREQPLVSLQGHPLVRTLGEAIHS